LIRRLPIDLSIGYPYVFPVRGEFKISYGRFGQFKMYSEGKDSIASRAYFSDAYSNDPAMAKALSALFLDAKSFYDIGANSGLYTLMAMKHPNLEEIHAFDPVPQVFRYLEKNIKINGLGAAKAHKVAIGRETGHTIFRIPQGILLPVGSSHQGSKKVFNDSKAIEVDVEMQTIDSFVERGHLPPDIIKIDTETTEPDVISGGKKTITTHRPSIIAEVLTDEVAKHIQVFFKPLNYSFFHLKGDQSIKISDLAPDPSFLNYALIPNERVDTYLKNLN
jgi:FkbM family methyltransferase